MGNQSTEDEVTIKKSIMVWSKEQDLLLLKEIAAEGVLLQRQKSRERGTLWQTVADHLTPVMGSALAVRSVRDRFATLTKNYQKKTVREERSTGGGGPPPSELEALLEEMISLAEATERDADRESELRKQQNEREKAKAVDMRERALERFGETRKRKSEENGLVPVVEKPKRRRSGEMLEWLKDKMEHEKKMKDEMNASEKEKDERRHMEWLQMMRAMQDQTNHQQQVQQQQQQQQVMVMQQQMFVFMKEQQQQQTQILSNLLKK